MEANIKATAHLMSRMDLSLRCDPFLLCPHIIGTIPSFLFIRTLIPDLSLPDLFLKGCAFQHHHSVYSVPVRLSRVISSQPTAGVEGF